VSGRAQKGRRVIPPKSERSPGGAARREGPGDARPRSRAATIAALEAIQADVAAFRPRGFGPPVHGPPVPSRIFLLGQAPGPHEARFGRPFAWTAGRTLFRWLERATGAGEADVRERVYISAVVRCFPGKAPGGGDRLPTPAECARWRGFVAREVAALQPRLVIPVGRLAIGEVLGHTEPIAAVVGRTLRATFHGVEVDVVPLPHPSGASTWFKTEPGRTLLDRALALLAAHPAVARAFAGRGRAA
jgi:uracil-DNA glycosylase